MLASGSLGRVQGLGSSDWRTEGVCARCPRPVQGRRPVEESVADMPLKLAQLQLLASDPIRLSARNHSA